MPYGRQNIHSDYPTRNMKGRSSHIPKSYTFDYMYNHQSAHNWNEPSDSRLQGLETDKQILDLLHYTQICFCLGSFKW